MKIEYVLLILCMLGAAILILAYSIMIIADRSDMWMENARKKYKDRSKED